MIKIIKETKERNKRTTPTLNKNNCSPSQKPNVVTDVAKRASQKSKPYNEHSNQPLERTRLLNLHEANVINENGRGIKITLDFTSRSKTDKRREQKQHYALLRSQQLLRAKPLRVEGPSEISRNC